MNLNDSEVMKQVMAKAVLDSMTPETRDELLSKAITDLVSKVDKTIHGTQKTPLEEAFEHATRQVAREVVEEKLKEPEFRMKIEKAVVEAIDRAFSSEKRDSLIENMAESVCAAFRIPSY